MINIKIQSLLLAEDIGCTMREQGNKRGVIPVLADRLGILVRNKDVFLYIYRKDADIYGVLEKF